MPECQYQHPHQPLGLKEVPGQAILLPVPDRAFLKYKTDPVTPCFAPFHDTPVLVGQSPNFLVRVIPELCWSAHPRLICSTIASFHKTSAPLCDLHKMSVGSPDGPLCPPSTGNTQLWAWPPPLSSAVLSLDITSVSQPYPELAG